jgi:hypothetical protein
MDTVRYAFAAVFGNADLVARLDALGAGDAIDRWVSDVTSRQGQVGDGFDTDKAACAIPWHLARVAHLDKLPHQGARRDWAGMGPR